MSQVDLIIPGLLNLPIDEFDRRQLQQQTPALSHLLSYARQIPSPIDDFDRVLIKRLGLQQPGLPYARALMTQDSGLPTLLVKALHLRPDINNAVLCPLENSNDKNILINDLSEYFKVDCYIKAQPGDHWLMQLHEVSSMPVMPHYLSLLGKKLSAYLEQARSSLAWYRLFNEMQMFMHQHELNQQRLARDLPIINSLWCWGSANFAGENFGSIQWFSDDWLMRRLGDLYCGRSYPLSEVAGSGIRQDTIIVDLSLLKMLKGETQGKLLQALLDIENLYLQPLLQSGARHIWLHTTGGRNFYYRPTHRWKFWKKPRTVLDLSGSIKNV